MKFSSNEEERWEILSIEFQLRIFIHFRDVVRRFSILNCQHECFCIECCLSRCFNDPRSIAVEYPLQTDVTFLLHRFISNKHPISDSSKICSFLLRKLNALNLTNVKYQSQRRTLLASVPLRLQNFFSAMVRKILSNVTSILYLVYDLEVSLVSFVFSRVSNMSVDDCERWYSSR